jgi:hypothetical protein
MKNKSIAKRILGIAVVVLLSSWVAVSAAPIVIDFEPEQCETRCLYILGYQYFCYTSCY